MKDRDMEWLLQQIPPIDLLDIDNLRVESIFRVIRDSKREKLPLTIGLFGNWGSGKTCFLAYLAKRLKATHAVIYFNAWKYAGFMEVVPALIYKILKTIPRKDSDTGELVAKILLTLGKEYSDVVGNWAQKFIGINPVDIYNKLKEIHDIVSDPEKIPQKVLDQYYTQIDRAQNLLEELFVGQVVPMVVLIDELDRCDPGEAFDVIKKMRIFFSMRNIPIIFVMCANPAPIGEAIKHQYGLNNNTCAYETRRILEKFVDQYVDMSDPMSLERYVERLWQSAKLLPDFMVNNLDKQIEADYSENNIRNCKMLQAISTNNYLYNNLRVLEKSLIYVQRQKIDITDLMWTAWHLEIVSQMYEDYRNNIGKLASDIGRITAYSHVSLFQSLIEKGYLNNVNKLVKKKIETDKGNTAFSIYRSFFWDYSKQHLMLLRRSNTSEDQEKAKILEKMLSDHHAMDFLSLMSLMPDNTNSIPTLDLGTFEQPNNTEWTNLVDFEHFSWLLANY